MTTKDFLKRVKSREPLTADQLNHDDPGLTIDPLSERSDQHFAELGDEIEKHPPASAGFRRG